MTNNKTLFVLYSTGVMILLLYSLHAYFLWFLSDSVILTCLLDLFVALVGISYISARKVNTGKSYKALIPFLLVWFVLAINPPGIARVFLVCPFTLYTVLLLDKQTLTKLLNIWANLYGFILLFSVIAWPFALSGVLPSAGIIQFNNVDNYLYQNHILCLIRISMQDFMRFCSIFLEPGHVAMIGALTLYAIRYNFKKWYTWVILIVSLITLSLAGYVLIMIGFSMILIQKVNSFKGFGSLFVTISIIAIAFTFASSYNNGNNVFNDYVVTRLESDDELIIAGNNRTTENTDYTYSRFINSSDYITGFSNAEYSRRIKDESISGAGYKMFLMQKGLIGTILVIIVYFLIKKRSLDKRFINLYLLLYIIAFLQRAWPTSYIWLFLFIFATAVAPPSKYKQQSIKQKLTM